MTTRRRLRAGLYLYIGIAFVLLTSPAGAQKAATRGPEPPPLLPADQEIQLALSAAPEHLRDGAGVYILKENGYEKVRESKNNFTCIVNRDRPLNRVPMCFDAEGTATIIPKILLVGELLRKRTPVPAVAAEVHAGYRTGKLISPRRPGVAYMLSASNCEFDRDTGKMEVFPPSVAFYAPNLTNVDIGSTGRIADGLPVIKFQGPQGMMLIASQEMAKMSTGVSICPVVPAGPHPSPSTPAPPNTDSQLNSAEFLSYRVGVYEM